MSASSLFFPEGARIALVGMGVSNRGVLNLLKSRPDLRITLRDRHTVSIPEPLPFWETARILTGESYLEGLDEDVLFLAPTVKTSAPEIRAAQARGARVTTDTAFFFENTRSTVFAVTGSDGKSTTCALSAQILRMMGKSVLLGGNIGAPLCEALTTEREGDFTVAELSSFQLMHAHKAQKRALLTNLTPNHLDFHATLDEYYNIKISLLSSAEEPILNLDDDEICRRFCLPSFVGYTTLERAPRAFSGEHLYAVKDDTVYLDGMPYLSLNEIRHRGHIFVKNLLAALALTHAYHDKETLAENLSTLTSLPHRRELVRELDGVRYYNSSVDSSPSRTKETLGDFSSGLIVILGGRSKGVPYEILADALSEKARAVILTGENASEIKDALKRLCRPLYECASLAEAVLLSASLAAKGDSVLFSPASTSFDRFQNFEERGRRFAELVNLL